VLLSRRIDAAFKTVTIDPDDFESCASDLLSSIYPRLSPITGGSDMGRDADLEGLEAGPRLVATTQKDSKANLKRSLAQLRKKIVLVKRVVFATSQPLSATRRQQLKAAAAEFGVKLEQTYDRTWFALRLLHSPPWRQRLLHVTAPPAVLVALPIELTTRGPLMPLVGRDDDLHQIVASEGDLALIGPPGMGKTRLLASIPGIAFLEPHLSGEQLAEEIDEMHPAVIAIEDLAQRKADIRMLRTLRHQEPHRNFRIIGTLWPDETKESLDLLPGALLMALEPLEQGQILAIAKALGIHNDWLQGEIVEQSRGRAGWAVALSEVALAGRAKSLFDGMALAGEVERYLRLSGGGSDDLLRILAHVALAGHVGPSELGRLASRVELSLHKLTKILYGSTADGILERTALGWRVDPPALRAALLTLWYFSAESREPAEVLADGTDPTLELDLLEAAFVCARYGSKTAHVFAFARITPFLEAATAGDEAALGLVERFAGIDSDAMELAMTSTVSPIVGLARSDSSVRHTALRIVREGVERFLNTRAIQILLAEVSNFTRRDNDPNHPIRILSDAALRLLPVIGTDVTRRKIVLKVALAWLDEDPSGQRWQVVARLAESIVGPEARGTWSKPGEPMSITMATGVESAEDMEILGRELWPELASRLGSAPDAAMLPLVQMVSVWSSVAAGVSHMDIKITATQRATATHVADRIANDLARRAKSSPGLSVRLSAVIGNRAKMAVKIDPDFKLLASAGGGTKGWPAHRRRIGRLAKKWARTESATTLLPRLQALNSQLELVGPGEHSLNFALDLLVDEIVDLEPWAIEAVRIKLPAYPIFDRAVRSPRTAIPQWFSRGIETPELRGYCLRSGLLLGAADRVAQYAVSQLRASDQIAIVGGLRGRDTADNVVAQLLVHPVLQVRSTTAVMLSPGTNWGPALPQNLASEWKAAIRDARSEHIPPYLQHDLAETLKALIADDPALVRDWLKMVIAEKASNGSSDGLGRAFRQLIPSLPVREREELLAALPSKDARRAFMLDMRGSDAPWVVSALGAGTITVYEANQVLWDCDHPYFEAVAPSLVRAGLPPTALMTELTLGVHSGPESVLYAELQQYCEQLMGRASAELRAIGEAGSKHYAQLQAEAVKEEHYERVYGL
jgi:hypothetical protein